MEQTEKIKFGLGKRLNVIKFIVVSVGLSIFAAGIIIHQRNTQIANLQKAGLQATELASLSLADALWNVDEAAMKQISEALLINEDLTFIKVVEASGEVPIEIGEEEVRSELDLFFEKEIVKEGEVIATIYLRMTSENIFQKLNQHAKQVAVTALTLILILILINYVAIKKYVARPIKSLKRSADILANGDLNHKIKSKRNDELGSLARSFTRMQTSIRQMISDIKELNYEGEKIARAGSNDQVSYILNEVFSRHNKAEQVLILKRGKTGFTLDLGRANPENDTLARPFFHKVNSWNSIINGEVFVFGDNDEYSGFLNNLDSDIFGQYIAIIGNSNQLSVSTSDPELMATLGRIAVSRIYELQMRDIIEKQNAELEKKVEERTTSLREKSSNMKAMFENIEQGIFMVEQNQLMIHSEYSTFLQQILGHTEIGNQPLESVLLSKSNLSPNKVDETTTALKCTVGHCEISWIANRHLLAKELEYTVNNDKVKKLQVLRLVKSLSLVFYRQLRTNIDALATFQLFESSPLLQRF